MNKERKGSCLSPVWTAVVLAALLCITRQANAALVSGPDIIAAPSSVIDNPPGAVNTHQQAFDERQGVTLPAALAVDGGTISAGTVVNSHMIFLNIPGGGSVSDLGVMWTFDGPVIGVMSDANGTREAASNALLGALGTTYPGAFASRGLESNDGYAVGGNTITVSMNVAQPGDWIRVVTLQALTADCRVIDGVAYLSTGPCEIVTAPFTTPDAVITTGSYSGYVELRVTGSGQSLAACFNDAFWVYTCGPEFHDPDHYQLTESSTVLVGAGGAGYDTQEAYKKIVFDVDADTEVTPPHVPAYRADHTYDFVLDTGLVIPGNLHFGVADGIFSDNSGAYTITLCQLVAVVPTFDSCTNSNTDLGCNPESIPECDPDVTASHECGSVGVECAETDAADGCHHSQTLTYTATNGDNTATCVQTYTWTKDTTPPTFDNCTDGNTDLGCNPESIPGCDPDVTASDECGSVAVECAETETADGCSHSLTLTYTATDGCGNTATCVQTSTWTEDTTGPVMDCASDLTAECDGQGNSAELNAWLSSTTATDGCGDVTITNDFTGLSDGPGATGSATVTWTATDECGNTSTCSATFTIVDTRPPVATVAGPGPVMWPPNHKYQTFHLSDCKVTVEDECDGALDVNSSGTIVSIYSDEKEDANGVGDGNTLDDIVILGPSSFMLRAERDGKGNGRVYGISFDVTDESGNSTPAVCHASVPHDQSGAPAVDNGPAAGYTVP